MSSISYLTPQGAALEFLKSKKFLIPAGIIILLLTVGAGTYFYLNHSTKTAVEAAVVNANASATTQTLQQQAKAQDATSQVEVRTIHIREQTIKDYENVSSKIATAPVEQRQASVPPLIIDTLNELDRMRAARNPDGVVDPEAPQG